ncbi:hypothetical protein [Anabaena azotica]|uniref:Uncharacterized protein n=1 Tax=Anabaena azotica FACHB-119 TaxID=947527 RepID=A0ABR8CYP0_9NOST|nr:hypothetical protein [Anabaena azotica]MBD2500049.1 hypothetical protein [Anabaena azotica FACHB-119]
MNIEQITEAILQMTVSSEYSLENIEEGNNEDEIKTRRKKIQERLMLLPGIDQKSEEPLGGGCLGCEENDPECCRQRLRMIIEKLSETSENIKIKDFDEIMNLIEKNYHDQEI